MPPLELSREAIAKEDWLWRDETSQEIWDQVHAALNFGDYRKATDGWVKFCGRWEKQNAETFEFEYCMDNYAVNLEKMKNEESEGVLTCAANLMAHVPDWYRMNQPLHTMSLHNIRSHSRINPIVLLAHTNHTL